jgi:hypothetical protein
MNTLEQTEAAQLAQHLEQCQTCRKYRDQILQVKQKVALLESLDTTSVELAPESFKRHAGLFGTPRNPSPNSRNPGMMESHFNRGLVLPSLGVIVLIMLVSLLFLRRPVVTLPVPSQSQSILPEHNPSNFAPTLANYHTLANQSLDELDDLIVRQSRRSVPTLPSFSAGSVALLTISE